MQGIRDTLKAELFIIQAEFASEIVSMGFYRMLKAGPFSSHRVKLYHRQQAAR